MKKQEGFTLIEVLVTLIIFSIGILAIALMQTMAIMANYSSRTYTEAITWAEYIMEDLINLDYDHADLDPASNPHQKVQGSYTISWNIMEDSIIENTKNVDIRVVWNDGIKLRTISIECVKARTD